MSRVIKILFLAANPSNTTRLKLDEEIRAIDRALQLAKFRDRFDIEQHWAVRVTDLQGLLLRHKPDIVHFSGHGGKSNEIVLKDDTRGSHSVPVHTLRKLFSVLKDNIRCVVLNACYSETQALAIGEHIDCVIGMSESIGDSTAIAFAAVFYQALGFGRDVKTAFDLGCLQIDLEGLGEQDIPRLLIRAGVDPKMYLLEFWGSEHPPEGSDIAKAVEEGAPAGDSQTKVKLPGWLMRVAIFLSVLLAFGVVWVLYSSSGDGWPWSRATPLPTPVHSAFCIRRGDSEELTVNDGAEITVQPKEPLILSLCTSDGTPVPLKTCHWQSSSTGHIDNPDGCVDVIYHAPSSDTDILILTVNDTSAAIKQLSLTIVVKP